MRCFCLSQYARQTHSVPTLRRRSVGAFPHTTAVDPPPVVQEREEGDEYEGDGDAGEKSERVKLWMHGEGTWPRTWEDIGICVCVCVCVCVWNVCGMCSQCGCDVRSSVITARVCVCVCVTNVETIDIFEGRQPHLSPPRH